MDARTLRRPKPTKDQIERRRDKVVSLIKGGYWLDQIATALDISDSTVTADKTARAKELSGIPIGGQGRRWEHRPYPGPPPFDWRAAPPPPPPPPGYEVTGPMPRVRALLEFLQESNARNQFGFNVTEAAAAGDVRFVSESQKVLAALESYLGDLSEMIVSADARALAGTMQVRDDLRELAAGDLPRAYNDPGSGKRLPRKGDGTPTRIHAAMWQEWWAGKDILSPDVVAKIAQKEASAVTRVRRAGQELLDALGPAR